MNRKDITKMYGTRYVCDGCYDEYVEKMKESQSIKNVKQIDSEAYKDLIAFICDLYDIIAPSMLITSQIKNYKEKNNYTYQGMKATLDYFFNIQEHGLDGSLGVGIIPFIYDETKQFYKEQKIMREMLKNCDVEEKVNIINIHTEDIEDDYQNMSLINISELEGDEN